MKFTQTVKIYRVNENNTVTVYAPSSAIPNKLEYYQLKAKFKLLAELNSLPQGTEIDAIIGIYYERGNGYVLQLVDYTLV